MVDLLAMDDIERTSILFSSLGSRLLTGDTEVAKYLYGNAWKESPSLIRTISELQNRLTVVEIKDSTDVYDDEFLYYWGMVCIGEVSRLIVKDLGAAEVCFNKVRKTIPKAKARLAFVKLLVSDEIYKSDNHVEKLEVLRRWAGKQDLFSMITLAKIAYYQYLMEEAENNTEGFGLPAKALQLLRLPCQKGHPVAIRFFRAILENMPSGAVPDAFSKDKGIFQPVTDVLYDL
jgi:hypothetical protein